MRRTWWVGWRRSVSLSQEPLTALIFWRESFHCFIISPWTSSALSFGVKDVRACTWRIWAFSISWAFWSWCRGDGSELGRTIDPWWFSSPPRESPRARSRLQHRNTLLDYKDRSHVIHLCNILRAKVFFSQKTIPPYALLGGFAALLVLNITLSISMSRSVLWSALSYKMLHLCAFGLKSESDRNGKCSRIRKSVQCSWCWVLDGVTGGRPVCSSFFVDSELH